MQNEPLIIPLADEAATRVLGAHLGALAQVGDVITLSGDLGAGKTTLARGFIHQVAERAEVSLPEVESPTFPIVLTYELGADIIWHFDLYRVEAEREILELGLEDALATGITLMEWPQIAAGMLPHDRLEVELSWVGAARMATLKGRLCAGDVSALKDLL